MASPCAPASRPYRPWAMPTSRPLRGYKAPRPPPCAARGRCWTWRNVATARAGSSCRPARCSRKTPSPAMRTLMRQWGAMRAGAGRIRGFERRFIGRLRGGVDFWLFLPLALVHKELIAIIFAAYLMLSAIRAELVGGLSVRLSVRAELVEALHWPIHMPLQRAEAGVCARRRSNFLLPRQEKVTKEKATLHAASLRFAAGNLRCSRPAGSRSNSLHFVALRQSRALIRWPLRSSAHPEGNLGSGHPLGPLLRCAALGPQRAGASRRDREAERSNGPCGCAAVGCSGAQPPAGCACGGAVAG